MNECTLTITVVIQAADAETACDLIEGSMPTEATVKDVVIKRDGFTIQYESSVE